MKYLALTMAGFAALFMLSGCGSSGETSRNAAASSDQQDHRVPLSLYEKTFNPSDYDVEITEVQRQHKIEEDRAAAERQRDSIVVESSFTQGYRIQIFATGNIDEANAMRMTALQRLTEDSLYVVYDPPNYKIRIGDFVTRADANQRLATVIAQGFADAWVVGDRIVQRTLIRVPIHPSPGKE